MKFFFRKMITSDLDIVLSWRNQAQIRINMINDQVINKKDHYEWFASLSNNNAVQYFIFEFNNEPIGVVNFSGIDNINKRCFWGCYLGVQGKPPGAGAIIEYWVLEYAFNYLKLNKLCGEVLEFNKPVLTLHKRFNFTQEGILKDHIYRDNQYHSLVQIAMINDQWDIHKEHIFSSLPKSYQNALLECLENTTNN